MLLKTKKHASVKYKLKLKNNIDKMKCIVSIGYLKSTPRFAILFFIYISNLFKSLILI